MVTNLFHPDEFAFVLPAFQLVKFTKAHLHGYASTAKWRCVKAMARQLIVGEMPATSEDTPSKVTGNVSDSY